MNPTNVPVPVSFADQTSLAFQAVASGRLRSVQVIPKRVAKPKKAAKATAAPRPAVASGRVTKKRGNRTARAKTPVQTAPAVPQGTAVPPPPFVPAAPQGIETPLFEQPLPPLPARYLLYEGQTSGVTVPGVQPQSLSVLPPPPTRCLLGEGQSSGIPSVTGTAQTQFISPPPPPQPQYFDNGFFNLSSQPNAAAALLSPGSQPPTQPTSGCFLPQSQPIFQAAPPAPPVPLPDVGTGLFDFDGVNLNSDPDTTSGLDYGNIFDFENIFPPSSSDPSQDLPASSQALSTPPAQDPLALPSQDLFAPPQGLLAPSQDLSTLPQDLFTLPEDLFTLPQDILAPPQGLPTPPQDLPDTSSRDLPAPSKELPAPLENFPSPCKSFLLPIQPPAC
ncbi:hypothetical protein NW754_014385 [Fusarium falciforme]|nr:hypothetical protein NW754_014385 [Fusarium falciforme]